MTNAPEKFSDQFSGALFNFLGFGYTVSPMPPEYDGSFYLERRSSDLGAFTLITGHFSGALVTFLAFGLRSECTLQFAGQN